MKINISEGPTWLICAGQLPCTENKLQYHNKTNVYTNLDSITHSPFHSTHTPLYISLLIMFKNSTSFCRILLLLVETTCSNVKALGRQAIPATVAVPVFKPLPAQPQSPTTVLQLTDYTLSIQGRDWKDSREGQLRPVRAGCSSRQLSWGKSISMMCPTGRERVGQWVVLA